MGNPAQMEKSMKSDHTRFGRDLVAESKRRAMEKLASAESMSLAKEVGYLCPNCGSDKWEGSMKDFCAFRAADRGIVYKHIYTKEIDLGSIVCSHCKDHAPAAWREAVTL